MKSSTASAIVSKISYHVFSEGEEFSDELDLGENPVTEQTAILVAQGMLFEDGFVQTTESYAFCFDGIVHTAHGDYEGLDGENEDDVEWNIDSDDDESAIESNGRTSDGEDDEEVDEDTNGDEATEELDFD